MNYHVHRQPWLIMAAIIFFQELIDEMTGEDANELLKGLNNFIPLVIHEVSDIVSRQRNQDDGPPPPDATVPSWCVCTYCTQMPKAIERVCCEMRPELCVSRRPVSESNNLYPPNLAMCGL